MHQQPSYIYVHCQEIQNELLKQNLFIQTFCVFPNLLVMQFSCHVL
jgi:hypothetical protein